MEKSVIDEFLLREIKFRVNWYHQYIIAFTHIIPQTPPVNLNNTED